jgi:hypothetical protein
MRYFLLTILILGTLMGSSLPKYETKTLKNGLQIVVIPLHNNTNKGGISILKSTNSVHSYPAYKTIRDGGGLSDEDSLVYIAGSSKYPNRHKLNRLLRKGLNVRYEVVNKHTNDCSMSNYVVLNKHTNNYFNIEAQHGDTQTQKKMIDILIKSLK